MDLVLEKACSVAQTRVTYPLTKESPMNADLDMHDSMSWTDDLSGRGFDELRELPYEIQAGLDLAVFE